MNFHEVVGDINEMNFYESFASVVLTLNIIVLDTMYGVVYLLCFWNIIVSLFQSICNVITLVQIYFQM